MEDLDFLDGQSPAELTAAAQTAEPAPAPEASPEPAPGEGPARGPDGKFISKAAEPAQAASTPEPQTPASPPEAAPQPTPEPQKAPDGFVPVSALTELRREFQAFKQSVSQQPPQPAPDPYEDFEAYQAWQTEQVAGERFGWSAQLLAAKHGEETAQQVQAWAAEKANADPLFYQRALQNRDPFSFAYDEWRREQVLSKLSDPKLLDQFLALTSGQIPQAAPAAAPAAPPQPPTPPRSLAAAPSAGGGQPGSVPLDDDALFGSTIR